MGKQVDAGWFGESLMNGTGVMKNFEGMIKDVYETEFKNLERNPGKKKIMVKDGKFVDDKNININDNNNFGVNDNGGIIIILKNIKIFNNNRKHNFLILKKI